MIAAALRLYPVDEEELNVRYTRRNKPGAPHARPDHAYRLPAHLIDDILADATEVCVYDATLSLVSV